MSRGEFAARYERSGCDNRAASQASGGDGGGRERDNPRRLLFTGCFELLHFGHLNALRQTKQCAVDASDVDETTERLANKNWVVAGIHKNADIAKVKGGTCILHENEKERMLLACRFVDEVAHGVPYDAIRPNVYNCDYCIHGDDEVHANGVDIFEHSKKAGTFRSIRRTEGISSTLMIQRFLNRAAGGVAAAEVASLGIAAGDEHRCESGKNELRTCRRALSAACTALQNQRAETAHAEDAAPALHEERNARQFVNVSARRVGKFLHPARSPLGKSIIYVQGVWDIFHVGYVDILMKVREMQVARRGLRFAGDVFVIVGVSGSFCGPALQSSMERAISLLSLELVDDVVFDVVNPIDKTFMNAFRIDTVYAIDNHPDFPADISPGPNIQPPGARVSFDAGGFFSSRTIINRIENCRSLLEERQKNKAEPDLQTASEKLQCNW